ncbi:class I SAM-dependent DNA methyltransferase [Aquibaculum arenosum]|uniref:Class I SAM-dependent methyltransferase n=1 Tax=Aquibaculum arenosum TaxID=3032591 RepID=A0ABT5YHI0_9PROT|nr:class I SAM-dependent methyltransferase [Fodinicurvata sp. CAU 1616]MDF2094396.1 class I SAM-dependent methyltransferase [Fodinicurvata sp. CAU 1616]
MSKNENADRERQEWLAKVYEAGGDTRLLAEHYDAWAARYDDDMVHLGYTNPALTVGLAGRFIQEPAARLLDAGAGTGIIGRLLSLLGYENIVAMDLSQGMLDRARELGVYRELHSMDMGKRLGFEDDCFDGCTAIGVLTVGHAPPAALDELVRVVRPGGVLIFSVTDKAFESGFGAKMQALADAGRWQHVAESKPYIPLPGAMGERGHGSRMFVYRVA